MKRIAFWLVLIEICILGGCCVSLPEPPLSGIDPALVGTWQGTAESPMGTVTMTAQFAVDGTYSVTTPLGTNSGTFSTDISEMPAWINVYNQREENWRGLYEVTGNTLLWSEDRCGRPVSLDSAAYRYTLTR
jgi:hypothetical protein